LEKDVCPECGRSFVGFDPETWSGHPKPKGVYRFLRRINPMMFLVCLMPICAFTGSYLGLVGYQYTRVTTSILGLLFDSQMYSDSLAMMLLVSVFALPMGFLCLNLHRHAPRNIWWYVLAIVICFFSALFSYLLISLSRI